MKYFFLFLFFPLRLFSQDVSGVWTGYMYNDTTQQNVQYELAINDSKGKLSGYSHTVFIIDSIKNIGVKSVKIKTKNGHYYIVDDKFVYNNYTEPPAEGVKQFSFLTFSENDSAEVLSGIWRTNATKIYKPLTGTIFLERKKTKIEETPIVAKLIQLGLSDKLNFLPPSLASKDQIAINRPNTPQKISSGATETPKEEKANKQEVLAPVIKKTPPAPPPAAEIATRKIETIRTVEIAQDSLVLSLYDNGTVDGDTVSVVVNGKVVMPRVGLLERAFNKTIYLTPDMGDSISVVMYAENLGSIPPNTGLLVIRDGEKNYEIRFSGDLKKNSEIILVRKRK
jgi:hypothetical protein